MYIHPTHPVSVDMMHGLLADAARRFPLRHDAGGGVARASAAWPKRYPRITLGALSSRRHDSVPGRASRPRLPQCSRTAARRSSSPPSTYLNEFYYDTVNFSQGALDAGDRFRRRGPHPRRQRLPAPDRQHPARCSMPSTKLPVTGRAAGGIYGGNAARILRL